MVGKKICVYHTWQGKLVSLVVFVMSNTITKFHWQCFMSQSITVTDDVVPIMLSLLVDYNKSPKNVAYTV